MNLSDYRTQLLNTIDISSNDPHYTLSYLNYCIQQEVKFLTALLIQYSSPWIQDVDKVNLSTAGNTSDTIDGVKLSLPPDFESIIQLTYQSTDSSTPEEVAIVSPYVYEQAETSGSAAYITGRNWCACVQGDYLGAYEMLFYPNPYGIGYLNLRYRFSPTMMTTDDMTSRLPVILDDVIVLGAALRAMTKSIEMERIQVIQNLYSTKLKTILQHLGNSGGTMGMPI